MNRRQLDQLAKDTARIMADNGARPKLSYAWDADDALTISGDGRSHRVYAPTVGKMSKRRWQEALHGTLFLLIPDLNNMRSNVVGNCGDCYRKGRGRIPVRSGHSCDRCGCGEVLT